MSGKKTWLESVSLRSQETKTALEAIRDAFDEGGQRCYQTVRSLIDQNNSFSHIEKGKLPQNFVNATSCAAFNALINRKKPNEASSSPLNWMAPHSYPQIRLIKGELKDAPASGETFLSISAPTIKNDKDVLEYAILKSNGTECKDDYVLSTCLLYKVTDDKELEAILNKLKSSSVRDRALVKTADGKLHFFSPEANGLKRYKETVIEKMPSTERLFDYIDALVLNDNKPYSSTPAIRKEVIAFYQSHLSNQQRQENANIALTEQPTYFEIDEIPEALKASETNRYDKRLDPLITHIKQKAAVNDVETFSASLSKDFISKLGDRGNSIAMLLSNEDLFRYQMAYLSLPPNPNNPKLKDAFIYQVKQKILNDAEKDISHILKNNTFQLPAETLTLAKSMLNSILYQSADERIIGALRLKQFLSTNWARGLVLTDEVPSEDLSPLELQAGPYAKKKVGRPQPLIIDENMPGYQDHADLLDSFKRQLGHYNAKIEIERAHQAIKTQFLIPKDEGEFNAIKKDARNAFIWFKEKLYHISSDGTIRDLPIDLQKEIWGRTKYPNLSDMKDAAIFKDAPITSAAEGALKQNKFYIIHDRSTNSYRIGYKENGAYQEKNLNQLLGNNVPFDPGLVLAQNTLKKAVEGASFVDYAKATLAQLPSPGQYISMVHRGKLLVAQGTYKFEYCNDNKAPGKIEKDKIYLYENDGSFYYAIITPNNEVIKDKKINLSDLSTVHNIENDTTLQAKILEEIYQNQHAYKRWFGLATDPNTVWAKYWTKSGSSDLKHNLSKQSAKAQATRKAAMKDQNPWGEFSDARREALGMVSQMAKGELSLNQHMNTPACGVTEYVAEESVDLTVDEHFKKRCLESDVGDYMYYLHVVSDRGQGNAVGLYFVDKSSGTPVITKVNPPTLENKKNSNESMFSMTRPTIEEDTPENFYSQIHLMLQQVSSPIYSDEPPDEYWKKFGFDHRENGVCIHGGVYELPLDLAEQQKDLDDIQKAVCSNEGRVILTSSLVGKDKKYTLYFKAEGACKSIDMDMEDNDHKIIIQNIATKSISNTAIEKLNSILHSQGVQVAIRRPLITKISDSLRKAIEVRTKKVLIPVDFYDAKRKKYAQIEVSNRLSYVVAQRRELCQRYNNALLEAVKAQLITQGYTISKDKLAVEQSHEKKAYIDPNSFELTVVGDDFALKSTISDMLKQKHIDKLEEPDVKAINRQILAEQYDTIVLDEDVYKQLLAWDKVGKMGEPPIKLSKNKLYLYQTDTTKNEWVCMGLSYRGEWGQTKPFDSSKVPPDILSVLEATEDAKITLSPVLIPDTVPFLKNCEEVQRLFFSKEDSRPSKGLLSIAYFFMGKSLLSTAYFPMEKRLKLMEMMTEYALDPDSPEARHYLRDHHMMYISDGVPEKRHNKDHGHSFYLNVKDPKHPILYQFTKNEEGDYCAEEIKLDDFNLTTPGRKLYNIAKSTKQGDEIRLSCKDVYYNITNQSSEGFKTGTAREMYEELYQEKVGCAKKIENVIGTILMAAMATGSFLMGNPAAGISWLPAIVIFVVYVMMLLVTSLLYLASFMYAQAAIPIFDWRNGGLSSLEKALDSLNISELQEKMDDIKNDFDALFAPESGLVGETVSAADSVTTQGPVSSTQQGSGPATLGN